MALAATLGVSGVVGLQQAAQGAPDAPASGSSTTPTGPIQETLKTIGLTAGSDGDATLGQHDTDPFSTLDVSWTDPTAKAPAKIEVRTRDAESGTWTGWNELDAAEPAGTTPAGARGSTDPLWVGASDGVQVQVNGDSTGVLPAGLRVDLIGDGPVGTKTPIRAAKMNTAVAPEDDTSSGTDPEAPADTTRPPNTGPASTAVKPAITSRSGWGADESISPEGPTYMDSVKAVFVHHTDTAASYNCTDSAAIIRGIYANHVQVQGWKDIGYNFLVDKCGTIFEGRKGGLDQPVEGAHTLGWNEDTTGVAVIGDYTNAGATTAALTSVARIAAWKLGQYGVSPKGTATLTTGTTQKNFFGKQYTAGQSYQFAAISGHRDGYNTQCPGNMLYPQLGTIRNYAADAPVVSVPTVGGGAFLDGTTQHTTGPVTLSWTSTTQNALLSRFELLDNGAVVATAGNTGRSASATLTGVGVHTLAVRATGTNGKTTTSASVQVTVDALPPATTFHPVTPTRLMDTRYGTGVRRGVVGPNGVVTLPVTGDTTGVPVDVTAVVLNVTATNTTSGSYVSVYPNGTTRTSASNLNFAKGQTIPNLVVVPVVNGKVDFYNHAGNTDLLADITGYYTADTTGSTFASLTPKRLMDTRYGTGVRKGVVGPNGVVSLPVTGGTTGVPTTGVTALVLNVTATGPTASSFVSVYPDGTTRTSASNLNFVKGQTIPNSVIVPVVNGKVDFFNHAGDVNLIADISGYYTSATTGAKYSNVGPRRLMDTRAGLGVRKGQVTGGGVISLPVTGDNGIPASGVKAVVLNVTATGPTASSFVSVYPDGTTRTSASNLNFVKGQTIANLVVVPVVNGKVDFYNLAGGVDLVADVTGYYMG